MRIEGLEYADEIGLSSRNRGIFDMLNDNGTLALAAEEYGLSIEGVKYVVKAFEQNVANYLTWRVRIKEEGLLAGSYFESRSPLTQAIVRAYAGGSSYAEAAREYGVSAEKVRQTMSRFMTGASRGENRRANRQILPQRQVGKRLQELRRGHGMSVIQFARWMGVSQRTVQRYESGECDPKSTKLLRLARFYGVTVDDILVVK